MATQNAQQPAPEEPEPAQVATSSVRAEATQLSIEEMSRIMDVAAALRRERKIASRELNRDQTRQMLRERLQEAADVSGDEITPAEIDFAIDQYFETQHEFKPPESGLETTMAHLYVLRGTIAKWAVVIAGGAVLWWSLFSFGIMPGEARNQRIANELYGQVRQTASAVEEMAVVPDVKARIVSLTKQAESYRDAGQVQELQAVAQEIAQQQAVLQQEYELQIAQSPQTGIDRYVEASGSISGYYLIVEARNTKGQPVKLPIRDAETGKIVRTSKWGEQVSKEVYDAVAADKQADGIVDQSTFAAKRRGEVDLQMKLPDAVRGRQITKW